MGLMSTLALLSLPLLKRTQELSPATDETVALKRRVAELQAKVDELNGKLDDATRDAAVARREATYWHEIVRIHRDLRDHWYQAELMRGFQQAQAHAQSQALSPYQQQSNLNAQNAQNQLSVWHDCTCVPGRSAAFGILRAGDDA